MPIVVFLSLVAGLVASRLIVAESDAHRLHQADRWSSPICSDCRSPLSPTMLRCVKSMHPQRLTNGVVLVLGPVLVVLSAFAAPSLWVWPAFAAFTLTLLLLTVTDLDTKLIPNRILGPAVIVCSGLLAIGWIADRESGSLGRAVLGGVAYFVAMYVLAILASGGLGYGDVKLAFLIGLFTGFIGWGAVVVAGVGAFVLGGAVSVALLVSGRFGRKDTIPFGPFLMVAGIAAALWGQSFVDWYTG